MTKTPDYEGLCETLGQMMSPAGQKAAQAIRTLMGEKAGLVEALTYARTALRVSMIVTGHDEHTSEIIKRIDGVLHKARALTRGTGDE